MDSRSKMLGEEKIGPLLMKMSVPATVAMLVGALYNVVDAIFIGQGVNPLALGGLAIAFPVQMIIMAVALMIGIGASSLVSISLGEKNKEKADKIAGNSFLLITIFSVITTVLGLIFLKPMLLMFGATDVLLPYAEDYMRVILYGTFVGAFAMSANNLIRAEGNAKVSMVTMLIGTVLNIILDPIFIFVLDLGVAGAAWATFISRIVTFVFVLWYFNSGKSSLKIKWHHLKPEFIFMKKILVLGLASFVRQIAGSLMAIVINRSLKHYGGLLSPVIIGGELVSAGDAYISFYGVFQRLLAFLFMPMFGVVQGFQPIVGFNYGAKNSGRVKETVKLSMIVVTIIALFGFALLMIFPELMINIFTKDVNLIQLGIKPVRIIIMLIPIAGIQIIGASLFQAIGKANEALLLSMSRQIILLIPLMLLLPLILPDNIKINGIWWSFPIADLLSTILTGFLLVKEMKLITKMNPQTVPVESEINRE